MFVDHDNITKQLETFVTEKFDNFGKNTDDNFINVNLVENQDITVQNYVENQSDNMIPIPSDTDLGILL